MTKRRDNVTTARPTARAHGRRRPRTPSPLPAILFDAGAVATPLAAEPIGDEGPAPAEGGRHGLLPRGGGRLALGVAATYTVASAIWIALSDWVLRVSAGRWADSGWMATTKGLGFVAVTGAFLYLIIARGTRRIAAANDLWSSASSSLDLVVDQMPGFVWTVDRDKRIVSLAGGTRIGDPAVAAHERAFVETMLEDPATRPAVVAALDRALAGDGALCEVESDGRLYETNVRPLRDAMGAITGAVALSLDRTEQAELGRRLAETQRLETVGQLASGIAHDFNNLLVSILGFTELARRTVRDEGTLSALDHVREAGDRAALLTRRLLAFSRREAVHPRVVDVNAVTAGLDAILRRLLGDEISLETSIDTRPCTVLVDPGQIEQVVLNLAVNARDAMPEGGRLLIATRLQGSSVCVEIADEGVGMDDPTRARAFEPFFTTKAHGTGTGLGLANVRTIVLAAGGSIELDSAPGKGSRFLITLPFAALPDSPVEPAAVAPARRAHHTEAVLLAEDEGLVRDFVGGLLRLEGFEVVEAASGREALALASEPGRRLDALVTDVAMPGMNGHELAERVRECRPGIPVVFVSGVAASPQPSRAAGDGVFLEKPFTAVDLIGAIERALDAR